MGGRVGNVSNLRRLGRVNAQGLGIRSEKIGGFTVLAALAPTVPTAIDTMVSLEQISRQLMVLSYFLAHCPTFAGLTRLGETISTG